MRIWLQRRFLYLCYFLVLSTDLFTEQCRHPQNLPVILLCPQCPAGTEWKKDPIHKYVISLLDSVISDGLCGFEVDPDRVYITGISTY